jgi:hypothetical protein
MEEQSFREEAHSSLSGGARFIGAGATPSMGLSEFRGGRKSSKCSVCHHKKCRCEDSSSSEEEEMEMEGGRRRGRKKGGAVSAPSGSTYRLFAPRVSVPYRGTDIPTAIVPYSGKRAPVGELTPYVPTPTVRTSTAIVPKSIGTMKPYNAAEAQYRTLPAPTGSKGSRASVLAGLAAAGIALGLTGVALNEFISSQANAAGQTAVDAGTAAETAYVEDTPPPRPQPGAPRGGPAPVAMPMNPSEMSPSDLAWYLQTGNLQDIRYTKGLKGKGKSDGRSARAAIVRKVMKEKGMSMIEASKHVKANNLY